MEHLLGAFARLSGQLIEAAAVLIVAYASLEAFVKILMLTVKGASFGWRKSIWQGYGMWLLLGLEFELAADIIHSVVSPTLLELAELGAIAVIRTFLSYFLQKDLADANATGEGEPHTYPARA